jgi:hypothetical protein
LEILAAMEQLEMPTIAVQPTSILDKHQKKVGHVGYHMHKMSEQELLRLTSAPRACPLFSG